ncbi:MAG: hypothetical protein ACO1TE_18000 [Prosthecobacter sp.]
MTSSIATLPLVQRLHAIPKADAVVFPYRLARLVARVLVSQRLRQRRKWCALARELAADPMVEKRLIHQGMRALERRNRWSKYLAAVHADIVPFFDSLDDIGRANQKVCVQLECLQLERD